ncbi:MAG: hypothetical protein DMF98_04240 [Acidobacteria bacterium]|nr:MAG: hypothetical protein DMF98_04240 [Acidobacteriota bacterium]
MSSPGSRRHETIGLRFGVAERSRQEHLNLHLPDRSPLRGDDVLLAILLICVLLPTSAALAQSSDSGRHAFVSRCAGCHGSDGNGGELGPAIAARVPSRTDEDLTSLFKQGLPASGMPAFPSMSDTETGELIRYVRGLRPRTGSGPVRATIPLTEGGSSIKARSTCNCWVTTAASTCSARAAAGIEPSPRRPTGPVTTARRAAAGTARSPRSRRATCPAPCPSGSSACPTPHACRQRPSSSTA